MRVLAAGSGVVREVVPAAPGPPAYVAPVVVLLVLLVLAFAGMWWGWRRRAGRHDLPELVPVPPRSAPRPEVLEAEARYFGTTVAGRWLERVTARGLGPRSSARLSLSDEGLDVVRPAGGFRIRAAALRGARHDMGLAGKVVPPHGLLVVTWQHGEHLLDTGFRLTGPAVAAHGVTEGHNTWIGAISRLVRDREEHHA